MDTKDPLYEAGVESIDPTVKVDVIPISDGIHGGRFMLRFSGAGKCRLSEIVTKDITIGSNVEVVANTVGGNVWLRGTGRLTCDLVTGEIQAGDKSLLKAQSVASMAVFFGGASASCGEFEGDLMVRGASVVTAVKVSGSAHLHDDAVCTFGEVGKTLHAADCCRVVVNGNVAKDVWAQHTSSVQVGDVGGHVFAWDSANVKAGNVKGKVVRNEHSVIDAVSSRDSNVLPTQPMPAGMD